MHTILHAVCVAAKEAGYTDSDTEDGPQAPDIAQICRSVVSHTGLLFKFVYFFV